MLEQQAVETGLRRVEDALAGELAKLRLELAGGEAITTGSTTRF